MSSPYVSPAVSRRLKGGCATAEGTLAWVQDRAYAWTGPAEGWRALAPAPSDIRTGFAVPAGVFVLTDGAMGFWAYGAPDWTWWQDDLSFSGITMPVEGWFLGQTPEAEDATTALLCCTEDGLHREDSVRAPASLSVGWVDDSPAEVVDGDGRRGALHVVTGDAIRVYDASLTSAPLSERLRREQTIESSPRRPSGPLELNPNRPPQLVGDGLFVHYRGRGSVRLDLHEGTVDPLGVAPISKSDALWAALETERPEVVATIVDTISALPPAPLFNTSAQVGARILDAHVEADGTVRSVLTRTGLLPEPDVPSPSPVSTREDAADENHTGSTGTVFEQHAPKTWALWLGRRSAEVELCHALCTSPRRDTPFRELTSGTVLLVEALLELIGTSACERLIGVLRETDPPETDRGDVDYNGEPLRRLATACGPEAASAVETALTDESAPVRVAACWAAGALRDTPVTSDLDSLDPATPGNSALWPNRTALPRDAIIENLTQEPPSLRIAAATTCARLRLPGSAEILLPLLREPPLLRDGCITLRETVLNALRVLPDVPDAARAEAKRCARADPNRSVRGAAGRVLGEHLCGPDAPDVLVRGVGDVPTVSRAAASVLPQCVENLSPSAYRALVDRWILRCMGARHARFNYDPVGEVNAPTTLLEDVLFRRLLHENQREPDEISSADELDRRRLSASSEWFEMAAWGLSVRRCWTRLFGEDDGEAAGSKRLAVATAVFEEAEETVRSDTVAPLVAAVHETAVHETDEDDLPRRILAMCDRAPNLGRRFAALAFHALGPPRNLEDTAAHGTSHQPMHRRLRSASTTPPPRERLNRILWQQLAEEEGAGGALGLYVLARHGDERAEACLIDRLAHGEFEGVRFLWALLDQTQPFCDRVEAFFESVLSPYLASAEVSLSRRWAAFRRTFSWGELEPEASAVRESAWQSFFQDCIEARDLLPWDDRHKAALHLAHRTGRPDALRSLWAENAESVDEIAECQMYAYARDILWAGAEDLWSALWARWPDKADVWGLRMLRRQGRSEAVEHIETAVRQEAVPEPEARETIKHIRRRITSQE